MIDRKQIELAQGHIDKGDYRLAYFELCLALSGKTETRNDRIILFADTLGQIEPFLSEDVSPHDLARFQEIVDFTIGRDALEEDS